MRLRVLLIESKVLDNSHILLYFSLIVNINASGMLKYYLIPLLAVCLEKVRTVKFTTMCTHGN